MSAVEVIVFILGAACVLAGALLISYPAALIALGALALLSVTDLGGN